MTDKERNELHAYYRERDRQFQLVGREAGCMKIAHAFYDQMESLPETQHILSLHPADLTLSREKLGLFLCNYFNGPDLYEKKFGRLALAPAHRHVPIGPEDSQAWLRCMKNALDLHGLDPEFIAFLMARFAFTAERVQNR